MCDTHIRTSGLRSRTFSLRQVQQLSPSQSAQLSSAQPTSSVVDAIVVVVHCRSFLYDMPSPLLDASVKACHGGWGRSNSSESLRPNPFYWWRVLNYVTSENKIISRQMGTRRDPSHTHNHTCKGLSAFLMTLELWLGRSVMAIIHTAVAVLVYLRPHHHQQCCFPCWMS